MTSRVVYVNNEPSTLMDFFFQSRRKTQPKMNKKVFFSSLDEQVADRVPQNQK